jgi:molybdopterin-guanine dinucleotide biosynthesis protein A
MRSVFSDLFLITNTPEEYLSLPVKVLVDNEPYQGPLGGIVTAMEHSFHSHFFVVACDMPLVNAALIQKIVERGRGWKAAIPVHGEQKEYLMALYSKNLLGPMKGALKREIRSLHEFCRELDQVVYLPMEGDATFNVNTPQDLQYLEARHAL